ncbi:capsular polysaccharide transport system permease protein [Rhizobium azibense]|nr:capsular polysaccharide transport system permease protein [Rhizobium azibense]
MSENSGKTASQKPAANMETIGGAHITRSGAENVPARTNALPNLHLLLGTDDGLVSKKMPEKGKAKKTWFGQLTKIKFRHAIIAATFALGVVVPASTISFYMAFVAADQYHSSASFSVRSIEAASAGDLMGIFSQASASSTTADGFILIDYIRSEQMLADAAKNFDLEKIFARRGGDFFFSLTPGLPVEEKLEYWRSMVGVTFDHASGIMALDLRAFDPDDAQKLTSFIISKSEALINQLSDKARGEVMRGAQQEVQLAEERLLKARSAVREYRDVSQEVDPVEGAKVASQIIGELEGKLAILSTTLATAKTQMSGESPRIKVLTAQIRSLKDQIASEKERLGSGAPGQIASSGDVAGRIQQFQNLATEEEFAEKAYTAAMASLEKARIDAGNKERYLATFIKPTLSEEAQFPRRLLTSLLALLGCLFAWSVGVMVYYNIRDRA